MTTYKIETISEFEQLDDRQKAELLKSLKVKKRLERYMATKSQMTNFEPYHRDCEHCHGGKVSIYPRDSSGVHPSGVFGCLKALWYSAADYRYLDCNYNEQANPRFDSRTLMTFAWGTALHKLLQGFGLDGAWCDPEHFHPETTLDPDTNSVAASLWVKGHADARIDQYLVEDVPHIGDVSVRMIHEYKSMRQDKFDKQMAPPAEHRWQATVYAGVLDVPIVVYLYVGKNTSTMQDFPMGFDTDLWDVIMDKIHKVQRLVDKWKTPNWKDTHAGSEKTKYGCKRCKFFGICNPPIEDGAPTKRRSL